MATFKITTLHDNHIWLFDVQSVETLMYCSEPVNGPATETHPDDRIEAWQVFQRDLDNLHNKELAEQIRYEMTLYGNYDQAVRSSLGYPSKMVFVKIQLNNKEPQLWLLQQGCNYLMVEGKTIDRI